jgi:hypothetical protein
MNDDVIQAGILKEFFNFLGPKGITVGVAPILAAELMDKVLRFLKIKMLIYEHKFKVLHS